MGRKTDGEPLTPEEQQFMEDLYDTYSKLMLYAARRCTSDEALIQDLVQDCLVCLMGQISTLRQLNREKTAAYIAISIRRLYLNGMKREGHLVSLEEEAVQKEVREKAIRVAVPLDADHRLDVMGMLSGLSQRDQLILTGYYIEGFTEEQLSRQLACKPDSVRMLRSRARKRALELLKKTKEGDKYAG